MGALTLLFGSRFYGTDRSVNERYSPHRPEEVRRGSQLQYESLWKGYASVRRALYSYARPPWEDKPAYNIWEDMAEQLDLNNLSKIVDLGTNDGYFHSVLRHKNFKGNFIGVDIEGKDLPVVEYIAKYMVQNRFPDTDVEFLQGDAHNLRGLVEDSSTPAAVAAFLVYHANRPGKIMSELHRILEPGGIGVISSRDVTNQLDTWSIARYLAHTHNFVFPQERARNGRFISGVPIEKVSVYSHFNINQTMASLSQSKKFKLLHACIQDGPLWIPTDQTGLFDIENAVESLLPYTVSLEDGRSPSDEEIEDMFVFLHKVMRKYFIASGLRNQQEQNLPMPCYISRVTQAYFVVEAVK